VPSMATLQGNDGRPDVIEHVTAQSVVLCSME